MSARALTRAFAGESEDHVAVALAGPRMARSRLTTSGQPDVALAALVGLVLIPHRAEREGSANRFERLDADGDPNHAAPRLIGTTLLAASLVTQVATGKAADAQVGTGGRVMAHRA